MSKKGCFSCPSTGSCGKKRLPKPNNFWNTCPRELDELPDTPCSMGMPLKNKEGKIIEEPACPWWVDDAKSNYCFWRWVQTNSLKTGKMDYLLQNEIAQKFACSSTKIHFVIKDGIKALQEGDHKDKLREFLQTDSQEDPGNSSSVHGLDLPEESDSEE